MTNPVSSDKISTAYTSSQANSAPSRSKETLATERKDQPPGHSADTADLERASARYAQSVQGESSIGSADQALARAARLRELIGADPKSGLQAHGNITQAKTDAALLAP
jgi:hypothetical protein